MRGTLFRYRIAFVFGWTRESATIDADEEGRERGPYKLIGGKIIIGSSVEGSELQFLQE